ncbi:hypothetical protein [Methylobacterium sp. E-045]|uniref:hypothetical protein n=1 Tax=Methylobacterium sp. E-045 TaxID=2836575 RepID=UPI001FBAAA6E|nr:hypothetical protein [Methylobacterium sp. E-045]MCJ2131584.1 hypothetical protein [Methylobacterium sp. E-045]
MTATCRWRRSDITDEMVCRAYVEMGALRDAIPPMEMAQHSFTTPGIEPAFEFEFVDEILVRNTGAPWKVVDAAIERAYDHGLIEFGVTMRSGWLTDKGKALLALKEEI